MSEDSIDSATTVQIPDHIESLETVKFLQFNDDAAETIWQTFLEDMLAEPDRADLFYCARSYVRGVAGDALYYGDDWIGVMQRIGVTSLFQQRIMDEEFVEMRLTGSCKEWILEMIKMRSEFLLSLDAVIKTPSQGVKKKVSHVDINGGLKSGPKIPKRGSSMPQVGTFSTGGSGPSIATTSEDAPDQLDGHKMLFKGGTLARLQKVHDGNNLNFIELTSTPPGDFSDLSRGLYLTKNAEVAWKYASWAKKLIDGNVVPVGIMKVAIPDYLLSSSKEIYGEEWRRFVWGCRNRKMPADLEYLTEFQWLVGGLCRQSQNLVAKMTDQSQLEVWKLRGNETASQYFTGHRAMFNLLRKECVGKVWITALA
jgi:hypothetical protein